MFDRPLDFCHSLLDMNTYESTTILLKALEELYDVLDQKTKAGIAVNQALSNEIFNKFYTPAINARIAINKARILIDNLELNH